MACTVKSGPSAIETMEEASGVIPDLEEWTYPLVFALDLWPGDLQNAVAGCLLYQSGAIVLQAKHQWKSLHVSGLGMLKQNAKHSCALFVKKREIKKCLYFQVSHLVFLTDKQMAYCGKHFYGASLM